MFPAKLIDAFGNGAAQPKIVARNGQHIHGLRGVKRGVGYLYPNGAHAVLGAPSDDLHVIEQANPATAAVTVFRRLKGGPHASTGESVESLAKQLIAALAGTAAREAQKFVSGRLDSR
ncbi:hypothetical protein D3C73_1450500 [compost metagenome]